MTQASAGGSAYNATVRTESNPNGVRPAKGHGTAYDAVVVTEE